MLLIGETALEFVSGQWTAVWLVCLSASLCLKNWSVAGVLACI